MALRMAPWDATTGSTCRFVKKATSSSANTFVGSDMARVSALPVRLMGITSYFLASCEGTRRTTSGSMSSCERVIGGDRGRDGAHAGPEGGQGDGGDAMLLGEREDGSRRLRDGLGVRLEIGSHDGAVNDVRGREVAARGQYGLADLHRALRHRFFLDDDAALALDGPGHPRAHGERGVGGVDDGVDLPVGDVTT